MITIRNNDLVGEFFGLVDGVSNKGIVIGTVVNDSSDLVFHEKSR